MKKLVIVFTLLTGVLGSVFAWERHENAVMLFDLVSTRTFIIEDSVTGKMKEVVVHPNLSKLLKDTTNNVIVYFPYDNSIKRNESDSISNGVFIIFYNQKHYPLQYNGRDVKSGLPLEFTKFNSDSIKVVLFYNYLPNNRRQWIVDQEYEHSYHSSAYLLKEPQEDKTFFQNLSPKYGKYTFRLYEKNSRRTLFTYSYNYLPIQMKIESGKAFGSFFESETDITKENDSNRIITLKYNQNNLSFKIAIDTNASKIIKYDCEYMLEGFDQNWKKVNDEYASTISYLSLLPGKYTFKIRHAKYPKGTLQTREFIIAPPFWKQSWFTSIVFIVFVVLIYGVWNYRRNKKLIRQTEEEKQKRKYVESEAKALRSQMNPHFMFNSLNAIQSFINGSNKDSANMYLSKFAELMRLVLVYSEKATITIEAEEKMLALFLELEALRFKFEYKILIDPALDKYNTEIPTMFIQPYVENAINHGIAGQQYGKIVVEFKKHNNFILCVIEDNGIGIKSARASHGHNSMGMRVTEDRLKILNLHHNINMTVKIIDLSEISESITGTRVEVCVPIGV